MFLRLKKVSLQQVMPRYGDISLIIARSVLKDSHSVDVLFNEFSDSLIMQLHAEMCRRLSAIYCKILSLFPALEAAKPRSKSGIQALCSLHVALEKAKNVLQHCSESSKLYLV